MIWVIICKDAYEGVEREFVGEPFSWFFRPCQFQKSIFMCVFIPLQLIKEITHIFNSIWPFRWHWLNYYTTIIRLKMNIAVILYWWHLRAYRSGLSIIFLHGGVRRIRQVLCWNLRANWVSLSVIFLLLLGSVCRICFILCWNLRTDWMSLRFITYPTLILSRFVCFVRCLVLICIYWLSRFIVNCFVLFGLHWHT